MVKKAVEGPLGQELTRIAAAKNLVILGFWENGFRQITNNKRPIRVPDDLKGIKMRTPGNPDRIKMFNLWGANAAPLDLTEVFSAWLKAAIGPYWHRQLTFSKWFLSDYLLAGIVFLNFVGMRRVIFRFNEALYRVEKPVRMLAGFTLSIYLLHQPLIYFYAALIDLPPAGYLRYTAVMVCVVATIFAIGSVTERKRFALRRWLLALSGPKAVPQRVAP